VCLFTKGSRHSPIVRFVGLNHYTGDHHKEHTNLQRWAGTLADNSIKRLSFRFIEPCDSWPSFILNLYFQYFIYCLFFLCFIEFVVIHLFAYFYVYFMFIFYLFTYLLIFNFKSPLCFFIVHAWNIERYLFDFSIINSSKEYFKFTKHLFYSS
jgi:hypothetical protein